MNGVTTRQSENSSEVSVGDVAAFKAPSTLTTTLFTAITMVAFAANSLLARMALGSAAADPAGFTTVRLVCGALTLWALVTISQRRKGQNRPGSWRSGWWLFLYAAAFSYAYVSLSTGTGALILFAAVQLTMIIAGLRQGERPPLIQWIGLAVAMGGLVLLVAPGLTAPSPVGSALMMMAGAAWGLYSIRGRGSANPMAETAGNFMRSVPFAAVVMIVALRSVTLSPSGLLLAAVSGSLTSGLGYVLWYAALRGLTTIQASIVQLSVPVLAAFGGVAVLSEEVTVRLVVAGVLILGGVMGAIVAERS
jgi:drug/metabolite transporter (DMT)-like permease